MICALFVLVVITNIVVFALYLCAPKGTKYEAWISGLLSQYKFNVYLRLYMLCYFDLTFFSTMKIVDGNDSTKMRRLELP